MEWIGTETPLRKTTLLWIFLISSCSTTPPADDSLADLMRKAKYEKYLDCIEYFKREEMRVPGRYEVFPDGLPKGIYCRRALNPN